VKEQLKKLAPHDYSKTAFSYVERDTGWEVWVDPPEQSNTGKPEFVTEEQADTDFGTRPMTTADMFRRGENARVEFKSSARWNQHTDRRDDAIELGVVKTVAGFMNARGGTLLIGVNDGGGVVGLKNDLELVEKHDLDRYENWLTTLLETTIGKPSITNVSLIFERFEGGDV
jgi:ATP-dependent Lon protease